MDQTKNGAWSNVDIKSLPDTIPNACLNGAHAFFDAQGVPWVSCGAYVFTAADGNKWTQFKEQRGDAFLDGKGRIWLNNGATIAVRDNNQWTTIKAQQAIGEEFFVNGAAAFTPDGTAYFAGAGTGTKLVSFNGTTWKKYTDAFKDDTIGNPSALLYTSKKELLVGSGGTVYKLNGDALAPVITGDLIGKALGENIPYNDDINDMVETPDGTLWLATKGSVLAWNGSQLTPNGVAEGMPAFETKDLAVDAKGDVWAATVHGIAHRTGTRWEAAVPATSNMSDGYIYALAIKGAPALPAATQPKTTTISGRAVQASQALPNTQVELCSEEPTYFKDRQQADTPCGNQFFHTTVQTNDQGVFRFQNVPTGVYTLALKDKEGNWKSFIGLDLVAVEPNKEVIKDVELK